MIRLSDELPRDDVQEQLCAWQAEIDAIVEFRVRVAEAKRRFKQKNRADNPTFCWVRGVLRAMCGDAERCCYCEDSLAAEIDHVRPKSLYPGKVFCWSNFLWVCPRCNKLKSDHFGIIKDEQIQRVPRSPRTEPPDGDPALIDPREEDPLDFLWLDLDTFALAPLRGLPSLAYERAEFTWRTLRLNEDALVSQRHNAYYHFVNEIKAYQSARQRGNTQLELDGHRARVRRYPHRIVWESMKRRPHELQPRHAALFEAAPECLSW